ncbi:MFS transporter [Pararobbsia silviterrae]|uniref:MFS transporter n=1 Tax=Pararobbsia silviterrae TaxID=1792498 RepID=A0A494Y586_9BURK|nr:MFS transporter [Pararobbsia silviterrae]RKP57856.1 MFS transporter [Pararobbsia silviterrae]
MGIRSNKVWLHTIIVFLAGSIATALVPLTVPILGPISKEFGIAGANLGWIVSFPTLICALGALAFGVVVDLTGDVRLLLAGIALVILGDAGVCLAPELWLLFAARLFQGLGYVCISVAGPAFIQRTTTGETRRAAMAFWAAHTPVGFAAAVFIGAQLVAAGLSWRFSFVGHALAALVVGLTLFALRHARSRTDMRRSAGTWRVLSTLPPYVVGLGALAAGMLQVSVMTMLPSILASRYGFSGPQSALTILVAMLANWCGSMVIVGTRVRKSPAMALPVTAVVAAVFGYNIVTGLTGALPATLACIMIFTATIGAANSLVWSLIPAAVPAPEAAGATAGLVTQCSFIGVLIGPPTFFAIRHENPMLIVLPFALLTILLLVPLIAEARSRVTCEPSRVA